jgi:hypothetical protein
MTSTALLLRAADETDRATLDRLAALDSAERLEGPALVAEADGTAVAAMSLNDGRVVADPFAHSAHAVQMLRLAARTTTPHRRERTRRLVQVFAT